jgi:hypothetical protein
MRNFNDFNSFIKKFDDDTSYRYKHGEYDKWYVGYYNKDGVELKGKNGKGIEDERAFKALLRYSKDVGVDTVFNDIMEIFERTIPQIDPQTVSDFIYQLSLKYGDNKIKVQKLLQYLYMAMISEEMKEISILGKYMKLLGVYQTLIDGFDPSVAARFSDEVGVKELYNELKTNYTLTETEDEDMDGHPINNIRIEPKGCRYENLTNKFFLEVLDFIIERIEKPLEKQIEKI